MILNYGHTIGHAIEAATHYKQLLHGEAVGWGSIAATRLGQQRGLITEAEANRIVSLILQYGPLSSFKAAAEKLVALTASDKKNRSGTLSFILPTGVGSVKIVRDVTHPELIEATEWMLAKMRDHTTTKTAKKRA
jgi:3-dehydroquinate synthase